jgi:signal transduction histidine kinase
LRTPLNAIYFAFRSVVEETELPQHVKELIFLGFKNTELLRIILNTLIDYSQLDIEECEIQFSPFCVDNLLQNCVEIYGGVCEMKNLSISYEPNSQGFTSINSDQERLMQIIVNLLSYCVRQTSHGSI